MFKKVEKKTKSPMMSRLINQFNNQNKNVNENKVNLNQVINNDPNNINQLSQSNASFMTSSQLLEYTIVNNAIKKKKTRGIFDAGSHRNKDIFIETDSEQYNSRRNSIDSNKKKRKRNCSKLIVDKATFHIPDTYSMGKGRKVIPNIKNNNKYSIKTFNNNFNINDINDLNDINDNDGYEYEKSEIIKIKKINYIPTDNPNERNDNNKFNKNKNKRIEEKRIILDKLKNNRNKKLNDNIPKNNNINDNINKENDLKKKRKTNNLSYSSNPMNNYKYPFVISLKSPNNPNEIYNRKKFYPKSNSKNPNFNNIYINHEGSNDLDNNTQFIPTNINNDNILPEKSESVVSPIKQNNFILQKKRVYDNNINNNNLRSSNSDNNIDSDLPISYIDTERQYLNYDSKFKALYIKKEKEYNNLLEDYNDIIVKYNNLKNKYDKLDNNNKANNTNSFNEKLEKEDIKDKNNDDEKEKVKKNLLLATISPSKNLAKSKSENNFVNNIYKVEPVEDHFPNFLNDSDNLKNNLNKFSSDLNIEQNINIFILNKNKKNNIINVQKNKYNLKKKIQNKIEKCNNINIIQKRERKFDEDKFIKDINEQIKLDFKYKNFELGKFKINKSNEIFLKSKTEKPKEYLNRNNLLKSNFYNNIIELNKNRLTINANDKFEITSKNRTKLKNNKIINNDNNNFIINKEEYFYLSSRAINNKISSSNYEIYKINDIYLSKPKKNICDSGTEPIRNLYNLIINRENEFEIISDNNEENKLEKLKEKNEFNKIIENEKFYIFPIKYKNKIFEDLNKEIIINDFNIYNNNKEKNIKQNKNFEIISDNQINIISFSKSEKINNSLIIENNNNLYIPDSGYSSKSHLFNENEFIKENNLNININNNQKKKTPLKKKDFHFNIKSKKKSKIHSINNEIYFELETDLVKKTKNKIDKLNKLCFIDNTNNFGIIVPKKLNQDNKIIKNDYLSIKGKNNKSNKYIINRCFSYNIFNEDKNKKNKYEKIKNDKIIYDINDENKDINIPNINYNHILNEINSEFPSKINKNNNKINKNSILSKIKNKGLDINVNKLKNKNFNNSNKSPLKNNLNILDKYENGEKGDIIEQNIDRILVQNKTLYLQNLVNQKMEKEKEIEKILKNKNLLLKHYFNNWRNNENNLILINKNKENNNYKMKNIFKKYDLNNSDKDIEEDSDEDLENKLSLKKQENNKNDNDETDNIDGIPDLSYIRNKLHVSIVKRIKITEDEINKYNTFVEIISSTIKKYIYKYLINQYRNN